MTFLSVGLPFVVHELGHYLMALLFGHRLTFKREGLRMVWAMPRLERTKQKAIAVAGFGTELLAVPFFYALGPVPGMAYNAVAILHFFLYPVYAFGSQYNDFQWFDKEEWDA